MGSPLGESNPRPTLREPLPVLTLALTRHVGCAIGTYTRLWPLQMTPVRTTNGATPRSSRPRQRRRGSSAQQELPVRRRPGPQGATGPQDRRDQSAGLEPKAPKASRVNLAILVPKDPRGPLVLPAPQVRRVPRVLRALQALRVRKDPKASRVRRVPWVRSVQRYSILVATMPAAGPSFLTARPSRGHG